MRTTLGMGPSFVFIVFAFAEFSISCVNFLLIIGRYGYLHMYRTEYKDCVFNISGMLLCGI